MENSTVINSVRSAMPELIDELKDTFLAALSEEHKAEARMIDQDTNMTTEQKIQARRQSTGIYISFILLTTVAVLLLK